MLQHFSQHHWWVMVVIAVYHQCARYKDKDMSLIRFKASLTTTWLGLRGSQEWSLLWLPIELFVFYRLSRGTLCNQIEQQLTSCPDIEMVRPTPLATMIIKHFTVKVPVEDMTDCLPLRYHTYHSDRLSHRPLSCTSLQCIPLVNPQPMQLNWPNLHEQLTQYGWFTLILSHDSHHQFYYQLREMWCAGGIRGCN